MSILERLHSREDLLSLSKEEQTVLCDEIRQFLIERVADSGGHLASNLGIVETTLAIHKVFSTDKDRLVFDVGHQSYVHKILTGRMDQFVNLRKYGGLSGFPKPEESIHDAFIAGHASNSVSVALGLARARTQSGQDHSVIALIGDGALTGGLAYEGLNDAGASGEPLIIILNDNTMSIGKNVGGMSKHLALLRLKPGYFGLKKAYRKFTLSFPGGKWIYRITHSLKEFLKRGLIGTSMFEEMGLTYLGPVDGHDVEKVSYLLQLAKDLHRPVLIHVITQKGRGYTPAEKEPHQYHGVGHFDPKEGVCPKTGRETFSSVFGDTLASLAERDSKICAITAAMEQGTGLEGFAQKYPKRFFDVGIAEGHAISLASGLAAGGLTPVVALYSTFLQRGYDMLLHDIALMGNHVVLAVDRCGLVGEDGATHHGVFDVGYLSQVPGLHIYAPATAKELRDALHLATQVHTGPVAIRYPRGYCGQDEQFPRTILGVAGARLTFVTYGSISAQVYKAVQLLRSENINAEVIRLTKLKPLDCEEILQSASATGHVIVVEEVVSAGCVGETIAEQILSTKIKCTVDLLNLGDTFTPHGTIEELYHHCGLDAKTIAQKAQEVLNNEN